MCLRVGSGAVSLAEKRLPVLPCLCLSITGGCGLVTGSNLSLIYWKLPLVRLITYLGISYIKEKFCFHLQHITEFLFWL